MAASPAARLDTESANMRISGNVRIW